MTSTLSVFVDMDGVLYNFDKAVEDIFGKPMRDFTKDDKDRFWGGQGFLSGVWSQAASTHTMPHAHTLLDTIAEALITPIILTSTGGGMHHYLIAREKARFLRALNMGRYPMVFVNNTREKAMFARSRDDLLIDDRESVLDAWAVRGTAVPWDPTHPNFQIGQKIDLLRKGLH